MANLSDNITWEPGVYQLETVDPVLGGPGGISNRQGQQLANRTAYLKKHVDDLESGATLPAGIATQSWVTAELEKRDAKQSVRAATTAAISLTGTQTIDGIALAVGDRVLVKNQVAGAENGLYVVAAGAWSRTSDANIDAEVTAGLQVFVSEGALNADTIWKLTTNDPIIIGTTALVFVDITAGFAPLASPSFSGNPTGPTPAQFDNDTSIATTEFVQRALGNFHGNAIYSGTGTIAAADAGKRIISSAAGITLSLPLLASVPTGTAFLIHAGAGGITIAPSSPDTFLAGPTAPATISIKDGSTALMFAAPNNWVLEAGDTLTAYSKFFDSSLAASGYQKLPSGLIVQWGSATIGSATAVTFPVAFPTACRSVVGTSEVTVCVLSSMTKSTASFTATSYNTNTQVAQSTTYSWIAIGY